MKGMKKMVTMLVILSMVVVFAGPANAAVQSYVVDITRSQIDDTGALEIQVERGDGAKRSFGIPDAQLNQMLAMVLTAQALNLQVVIRVDWSVAGSDIESLRVDSNLP